MSAYIIGADRLSSGRLFCAATDRSHNTVYLHEGDAWRRLVGWSGHEVTACCACGETIVCAAQDDVAYVIDGTTISRVTLPDKTRTTVYGCCATGPDAALLGGAGGLFSLSVRDQTAARVRLSDFNVSKPGRNIHNVVRAGGRTWILGAKNLLVEFRGDSAVEPVPKDVLRGREVMFGDAAELGGRLWLSAREGARAMLAELDGHTLRFHDTPQPGQSMARLLAFDGELFAGGDKLTAGRPGAWRDLPTAGMTAGSGIVALVPVDARDEVCAISNGGQSWFTDGQSCRAVPVF